MAAQESTEHGDVRHDRHVRVVDVRLERADCDDGDLHEREQRRSDGPGWTSTNTPNMVMAGPGTGMNMNGADASAAAGLNTTKANWHYTGPALPTAEAQELLAQGENGPTDIHMLMSGCATEPTFSEQINAVQYVQSTSQAVARYTSPSAALAAGYVPVSPTNYPVVYYVNPTIVAANAAAGRTLDPQQRGRPRLRPDTFGPGGAGGSDVPLAVDRDSAHALRRLGPVASAHGCLWPEQRARRRTLSRSREYHPARPGASSSPRRS